VYRVLSHAANAPLSVWGSGRAAQVRALVAEKVEKFPSAAAAHLMAGLVAEGEGHSPHDGHAHGCVGLLSSPLYLAQLSGALTNNTSMNRGRLRCRHRNV